MRVNVVLALALAAGCHRERSAPAEWTYEASDWAHAGYPECGAAVESPIDIARAHTIKAALPPLELHYGTVPVELTDNGHTIVAKVPPGSTLAVNGTTVPLVQFHFHRTSEHLIDGKSFDAELHLVHQDAAAGNTFVIGVLLKAGAPHPELAKVIDRIATGNAPQPTAAVELAALLPADLRYFNYTGSLTTPPCTAGVDWIVLETPVEVSPQQLDALARRYDHNHRPVQPLHGRPVLEGI